MKCFTNSSRFSWANEALIFLLIPSNSTNSAPNVGTIAEISARFSPLTSQTTYYDVYNSKYDNIGSHAQEKYRKYIG